MLLLAGIGLLILAIWIEIKHKRIRSNCVAFVSGSPKTGKSLLAVYLCYRKFRSNLFKARFENFIRRIIRKVEKPLPKLYSNIPLNVDGYAPLLPAHLERKLKFEDRSVVYLGEFSLVANSRLGQNSGNKNGIDYDRLNEELLLFTKLIGHECKGVYMVLDSQTIADCHYAAKRCLSNYFYIHHSVNLLFHKILFVQECIYSEDNSTQQNFNEDIESNLKWLLIPKRKYYKMYDYRCYSVLTDQLPLSDSSGEPADDLKARDILSFVPFKTIGKKEVKNNETKEAKKC